MSTYAEDLRELVIRPTLVFFSDWSATAENLLLGTAAQESQLGFRMQSCRGQRHGIYGISPHTHIEVWDKFLVTNPDPASQVRGLASQQEFLRAPHAELFINLGYATAIAWMIYKRHGLLLNESATPHELAKYWWDYYEGRDLHGMRSIGSEKKSSLDKFVRNYKKFVLCEKKRLVA